MNHLWIKKKNAYHSVWGHSDEIKNCLYKTFKQTDKDYMDHFNFKIYL